MDGLPPDIHGGNSRRREDDYLFFRMRAEIIEQR
jgi:hypothetical protein